MIVLFALGIVARLMMLQIMNGARYRALASEQHEVLQKLFPERGEILSLDRERRASPLATTTTTHLVFADPSEIALKEEEMQALASILTLPLQEVQEKITDKEKRYVVLKKEVSADIVATLTEQQWKGIGTQTVPGRTYPEKSIGAHVLGFVGETEQGLRGNYGLEEYFEELLRGRQGLLRQEQDNKGRPLMLGDRQLYPAEGGATLTTTLDRSIEFFACNALNEAVKRHSATVGSVLILEPATGKIIGLCSHPTFDPNQYRDVKDIAVFNNQVIFGAWEPGSIFKTLTIASALDAGKITPLTRYNDEGSIKMHEFTIRIADHKVYGMQTMTQVLENSINTGAVFAQEQLGNEAFKTYVENFGMGQKTGIELPGEVEGTTSSLAKKGAIFAATASFGQGITATPLQMALAYGVIANGGSLMKPYVVEEISIPGGEKISSNPRMIRRVISEGTARMMRSMLQAVVERGHGKRASVAGYSVGGKTGTSQVAKQHAKGYEEGKYIGSFVGFAPVENPRFVMAVRIDNPQDVIYAESTAAPLFGEIAKFLLQYLEVPKDK